MPLGGGSHLSKQFIFFFGYGSVSSYYLWVGVLVTAKTADISSSFHKYQAVVLDVFFNTR